MAFEDYDVKLAFARIEEELISSMMRNLANHLKEESDEGFDWSQWQVEQLKYLEEHRKRNKEKFGPQFADINQKMQEAIQDAVDRGQKDEEIRILKDLAANKKIQRRYANQHKASIEAQGDAFFRVNDNKLEALLTATQNDMEKAEQAVLRRANDQYRKIIFDAQVYANTGAGTIEKAIDMAAKDFLSRGIDSIEYKNGTRHTIKDYADMYIRTAERRAYLMGEGNKRKEWGMSLVLVNKRGSMRDGDYGTACPQCIPWLGKVLIDDVYSGGKPDGKHKLLSEAMAAGFLHPRCKDGFTTYFPGISSTPDPDATKKELKEAAEAEKKEARENYVERQEERFERLADNSLDPEDRKIYEARADGWHKERTGMSFKNEQERIQELNRKTSETVLSSYETRRVKDNLNLTPADSLRELYAKDGNSGSTGFVDFTGLSAQSAEAASGTIEKLSQDYVSGITHIKIGSAEEFLGDPNAFAFVQHNDRLGEHELILNPHKMKNYERMCDRIRKLSDNGKIAYIPEGLEGEYVVTHEFAHGLLQVGKDVRKDYIGQDLTRINQTRKKIRDLYEEYMDEIRVLQEEVSRLEADPDFLSDDIEKQMAALERLGEATDRLNAVKISDYSMENADEFMAEAFTQHRIGVSQSKYSDRVMEVLDREYGQNKKKYARKLIDEILDPENEAPIEWPARGKMMGREKAKRLRKYAKQKGIDLIGLADYDLPEESAKEVVDDAVEYLKNYPELKEGRPSISFTAEYMNSSKSFAATTNHLVKINADAYRNLDRLEEEYQKLVEKHWFPQGTDHHALIAHEIGHVIHHRYPEIDPIEIAMKISGKNSRTGLMEYISEHLSEYAAYYKNGQEIISECYACVLTGTNNDFALKFVQECDKIIKKKR